MSSFLLPKSLLWSKLNRSYSDECLDEKKRKETQAKPPVKSRDGPHPLLKMAPKACALKPVQPFWPHPRHVVTKQKKTEYKKVAFMRAVEFIPSLPENDNDEADEQYTNMM